MSIAVIANALLTGKSLRLYSHCHDRFWTATFTEREQIRKALAALNMEPHTQRAAPHAKQQMAKMPRRHPISSPGRSVKL
jgi:hypothetical protein